MASIESYETARGRRYRVRWRYRGRSQRQSDIPSLRAAKALQREVEEALAQGRNWSRATGPVPALGPALGEWLASLRRAGRSPRTLETYHRSVEDFAQWLQAKKRRTPLLSDLTREALEGWYDHKLDTCTPLSAKTRLSPLRTAWAWLWDRYPDEANPPRRLDIAPGRVAKPGRAPTWAQVDAMIAHLRQPFLSCAIIQRYTGIRVWQALRLEWRDVDLEARTLHIRPELGKTRRERKGRTVPMAPPLVDWLAAQSGGQGRIVPNGRYGAQPGRDSTGRAYRRAWSKAGIPPEFHGGQPTQALRKALITELTVRGVPEPIIQTLVGHASGNVTGDTYLDRYRLPLVEAVALIEPIGATGVVVEMKARATPVDSD